MRAPRLSRLSLRLLENRDLPAPLAGLPDALGHAHGGGCCCPFCDAQPALPGMIFTGPFPAAPQQSPPIPGGNGGGPPGPLQPPEIPFTYTTNGFGLPLLSSNTAGPVAVFLDFDGFTNASVTYTPYDTDDNPTTFNAEEQARIVEVWRQTAIFFAMFDVNVTTIQPPTTTPTAWQQIGNNINHAYAYYSFPSNNQPTGFSQSSYIHDRQTVIPHEVGHIFYLGHQSNYDLLGRKTAEYSSGDNQRHVPIMGVDFAGVTRQWYLGHPTNTAEGLQDDLTVIANQIKAYQPVGGDGYRADDHGNTTATATALALGTGGVWCGWGTIERMTDADVFSFNSPGGNFAVEVVPTYPSALDAKLDVFTAGNVRVATVDASTNEQTVSLNLPAGTYHFTVSSHGDYGDVGAYQIHARPLPADWDTLNIGLVADGGYAGFDAATDTFAIGGGGADVWGAADGFRFAYRTLTGNGSITARVDATELTSDHAKVGVMIRETLEPGSRHAFALFKPSNVVEMVARSTANANAFSSASAAIPGVPYWIRLTRSGNTFTTHYSPDGSAWTQHASFTVAMNTNTFIGLAVSATNNSQINNRLDARFSQVSFTGNVGPAAPVYNALPAPTGVAVVRGAGTSFDLTWDAVAGATSYAVDRSDDGVRWAQIATPGGTTLNTAVAGSQRFFFRVSARDAVGRSVPSAVVSEINRPSAPANFSISTTGFGKLVLNWTDVNGDTGYRVERSDNGGTTWSPVGTVGTNVPSYLVSGLSHVSGTSYRVVPLSPFGDGVPSAAVNAPLAGVENLRFATLTSNAITLRWDAVPEATGYRVERSTDGTVYTLAGVVSTTSFNEINVFALSEYYYRVAGVNSQTQSVIGSSIFAATPAANPLPEPWKQLDLGAVGGRGAAGQSGSAFTLLSSGNDIWDSADAFRFVYQPMTGDGTITARVTSQEYTAFWAKGGVMIREGLTPNSRQAMMLRSPGGAAAFQWRDATSGGTGNVNVWDTVAPYWVRLVRAGDTFTGFGSTNGTTWAPIGTATIDMAATVYVGLAVSAGNNAVLKRAVFDNVTVSQAALTPATFTVTTTADIGAGSLRQAITDANTNPGRDTITFNIPGTGLVRTITPLSPLPSITDGVVIDGWTQSGWTSTPLIELNGTSAGSKVAGLTVLAGQSLIRGLAVNRFNGAGILLSGPAASGNTLQANHIGIDPAGSVDRGNGADGLLFNAGANFNVAVDNVISGNTFSGVTMTDSFTSFNRVSGGRVGTNLAGNAAIRNDDDGVRILFGASHNIIGTDGDGVNDANEGVLISGNQDYGVQIYAGGTDNNRIAGNRIGTTAAGTGKLANAFEGLVIHYGPRFNIIGTNGDGVSDTLEGNLISGHNSHAVVIARGGTDNNVVAGNLIGFTPNGNTALGNNGRGVWVFDGARNTRIGSDFDGTSDAAERNVIGNGSSDGITIQSATTVNTLIQGNFIGTDVTGTVARKNTAHGIQINDAAGSRVEGNTIAFNGFDGVAVTGATAVGHFIRGNSIVSNSGLGIDLANNGATANDPLDADVGPNQLQNYPLVAAVIGGPTTSVSGSLNSLPNEIFAIDLYASAAGGTQGARYLGSTSVTTDAAGNASFTATGLAAVYAGEAVTATATDAIGNTSEFSPASAVPARVQTVAVNDGEVQRSRVTNLTLTFNGVVTLSAGAISLSGSKGLVNVTLDLSGSTATNSVAKLTFNADANAEAGSLYDGRFTLAVTAAKVTGAAFDGNGDGKVGDDYASGPEVVYRLFGDGDGNAAVNFSDFLAFRTAFGTATPGSPFDADNDSQVNFTDFLAFRTRFGVSV